MASYLYNFFYYVIGFSLALFFIFGGVIGMLLPWSPYLQTDIIQFLLDNSIAITLFGFAFTIIGLILIVNLYIRSRKNYYYIRVNSQLTAVDEAILQHYLEAYWQDLFPHQQIPMRLALKRNKIKVIADLPYMPISEQKQYLERIQNDLREMLQRIFGYSRDFVLAINFQSK